MFGLGFYVLALNYQSFSGGFWDIKEQKIKKMCEFVMLKLKEWNQKNNDEIKRIKVKDCFWHSKFDIWVNSEWLTDELVMRSMRVAKFLNFQIVKE